jgi:hypothetical protein
MRLFYTLFFLILCSFTFAQKVQNEYKYKGYVINVSDSLLTVVDEKNNSTDTIFKDEDEEYYLTEKGQKVSMVQMQQLKLSNQQKFHVIDSMGEHYIAKENSSILSIAGPYISYSYEYYYDGGAHPSYGVGYNTYNIETKKNFSLLDFFSNEELFTELIKNEFILQYINPENTANLKQLTGDFFMNVEAQYLLDFSSFSFGKINGSKVTINLGLSHDAEVYRGSFELLSFQLNIPEKLKEMLEASLKANLLDTD